MKKIQIGGHKKVKGKYRIIAFALVDDEDFELLNQWKWSFSGEGYVMRFEKSKAILMHRIINKTPDGFDTDHKNHNVLDNRKLNLRTATRSENNINMKVPKHNTSGYKGVTWNKKRNLWQAQIQLNYKNIILGFFKDKLEAIKIRKQKEVF